MDRDADVDARESARIALETQMIALTNEADRLCGRRTVAPAAAVAESAFAPESDPEPSPRAQRWGPAPGGKRWLNQGAEQT